VSCPHAGSIDILFFYCIETMLTGESRFHISTPLGIEPGSLMTGSKGLIHWTSETVRECSEISGSPHHDKCVLFGKVFPEKETEAVLDG
jgi:hypothetical protein